MAETVYTPFAADPDAAPVRLIVRRVRPMLGSQLALFALLTSTPSSATARARPWTLEADHRRHAKRSRSHSRPQYGAANGTWLAMQVLAHNLARWMSRIALGDGVVTTKTLRRQLVSLAGRITRSARRITPHLPARWPWALSFLNALRRLRTIPLLA